MYRQIFIPNEQNNFIPLTIPNEWYGKLVEVIAFPIYTSNVSHGKTDDDFFNLCGAWESELNAEEMISELKSARSFRERNISL